MPVPQIKITYYPFDPSASIQSDCVVIFRSTVPEKASLYALSKAPERAGWEKKTKGCHVFSLFFSYPMSRQTEMRVVVSFKNKMQEALNKGAQQTPVSCKIIPKL